MHRDNEQRLKKLGKSLSVESKQYRAKRINVNVKINGLGYLAEILGGFLMLLTTFHHKVSIQNTVALFWMGNVIPSCYLINFVHHKKGIMNDGWVSTISQLYRKKKVKPHPSSSPSQIKYSSNRKEVRIVDQCSNVQKVKRNVVAPRTETHNRNLKSCHCGNCQAQDLKNPPLNDEPNQNRDEIIIFDLESSSTGNDDTGTKYLPVFNPPES